MSGFDLRTADGIESAQADLNRFIASIDTCVTRDLLPWGLGIGHRQVLINNARSRLSTPDALKGDANP